MHLLLDTHIFIWFVNSDLRLAETYRDMILNASEVYISSASIWEANIKIKLKRYESGIKADINQLVKSITASGFIELPITARHAAAISDLPDIHKDPFDRILIAQAICEPLTFFTADRILEGYSDLVKVIK